MLIALVDMLLSSSTYLDELLAHVVSSTEVDCVVVVPYEARDGFSHIFYLRELDQ